MMTLPVRREFSDQPLGIVRRLMRPPAAAGCKPVLGRMVTSVRPSIRDDAEDS
jgi:hypothetical protein